MKFHLLAICALGLWGCLTSSKKSHDNPEVIQSADKRIVISEVMSSNLNTISDDSGGTPDWIELHNISPDTVNLSGFSLSDSKSKKDKWVFDSLLLIPDERLLVFASGRDIKHPAAPPKPLDLISKHVVTYADGDKKKDKTGSKVELYKYPKFANITPEGIVIAANLFRADNSITENNWGYAGLNMRFSKNDSIHDLSAYNQLQLKLTLPKNKSLEVFLCQENLQCDKGFSVILWGTGVDNDTYIIPIGGYRPGLNPANLTGLTFHISAAWYGNTPFILKQVRFQHSGFHHHTNFKLKSGGETLYLYDPKRRLADKVKIPRLKEGYSYIRRPDTALFEISGTPTPGKKNSANIYKGFLKSPEFETVSGFYDSLVYVSIKFDSAMGQLHYTLNGSDPTPQSPAYVKPLLINRTTVVRARYFKKAYASSRISTNSYFINEPTTMAAVSISGNYGSFWDKDTGIYFKGDSSNSKMPFFGANFWDDKEIGINIEFFEPRGVRGFSERAGLSIFGNWSRSNPKRSLAIYFKKKYGKGKLKYSLFPHAPEVKEFDNFLLRNAGGDYGGTKIRDVLMSSLMAERGLDYQKFRPVVVYLNGDYWGVYNMREKLVSGYFWSNYQLEEHEIDLIKPFGEIQAGDREHYDAMLEYIDRNNIRESSHYEHVKTLMDMHNYIYYQAVEIYGINTDWPANNIKYWRPKTPEGKWRWMLYDLDAAMSAWGQANNQDMVAWATNDESTGYPNGREYTFLFRRLLLNESFKADFINGFCTLLGTTLSQNRISYFIDSLYNTLRPEMPKDIKRWQTSGGWKFQIEKLKTFVKKREPYIYKHLQQNFDCGDTVKVVINSAGKKVAVNGTAIQNYPFTGTFFTGIPLTITMSFKPGPPAIVKLTADTTLNF